MIEQLTPSELTARIRGGEAWQLVDVREAWELGIVELPDSIKIPMGEVPFRHAELDRETPIAVICHGGARSYRVALHLRSLGFERLANISGGIDAWAVEVDPSLPRY